MADKEQKTQVAVIGAGPGGYAAAFMAADLGMKTALIDPEPDPGGVCLYRGCIPTKALLNVVRVKAEIKNAAQWGVSFGSPEIDIEKLRSWKNGVVKKLTRGVGQLVSARKILYIRGRGRFVSPDRLRIEEGGAKQRTLSFDHTIVATGARPAPLGELRFDNKRVFDSSRALELEEIPETMLVVGGGYIGLELGSVYASLGTRVSIVEMMSGILPGADRDLVSVFTRSSEKSFEKIMVDTRAEFDVGDQGVRAVMESGDGERNEQIYDTVLVTVGRVPNSEHIGLEEADVRTDEHGFVRVDEQQRTSQPNIFAIGDVAGAPLLAHKATHEGRVAAEAAAGEKTAFDARVIPSVEYTDPEIAWCGLTETEAGQTNRSIRMTAFNWKASGRAQTLGRQDGLTKLIIDPETDRILGAGIVGPGAGELISECALAIEMSARVSDLALTIHPHPTLAETIMEAAELYYGTATHLYRPRRK